MDVMQSQPESLVDGFGRTVSYVRISVTDRCDFRCVYCMSEDMQFLPRESILTLEELYQVAETFAAMGVKQIRLTGGEPLVRRGVLSLIEKLGTLPLELTITTNGSQLETMAASLKAAGINRINVSLDTLDAAKFKALTRTDRLAQVLRGLDAAAAANFDRVKLNAVIMKGRNDDEVEQLVQYAVLKGFDISFIEEMPLGQISEHSRELTFCSSDEILERLNNVFRLHASSYKTGGPSRYYRIEGSDTRVGFISPHSHNFCDQCNRVRVTAEGRLLLCLGNEHSMDLRQVLRDHPNDQQVLKQALISAMDLKPERHWFDLEAEPQILRFMNMTGG